MNKLEIKKSIRKIVPDFLIRPILNMYRVGKFIFISGSNNTKDLKLLHEIQLDRLKANHNQRNILVQKYKDLHADLSQKELCRANEFKVSSQHGEDGLIMYIFSKIGAVNHKFIEFGAGGKTSNTENLIVNFGWSGLLIDGSQEALDDTKSRYKSYGISDDKVKALCSWITKDNINELFAKSGMDGEIDLLSIDIDGNDYWIWEAIDNINPRLVVVEYNASLGKNKNLVMPYDEKHFNRFKFESLGLFYGASIGAFNYLAEKKGYSLVCCESSGVNAFFVRNDLLDNNFIKITPEEAFYEDQYRNTLGSFKIQSEVVKKLNFMEVGNNDEIN